MLTFLNKKSRRALPTPSSTPTPTSTSTDTSTPHSALKPLRLVDKLVAARVIDRLLPKKKSGSANNDSQNVRKELRTPPTETATLKKRAPFVVSLRVSDTPARPTPSRGTKTPVRRLTRTAREDIDPKLVAVRPTVPSPRPLQVAFKMVKKSPAASRIPVLVGRPSAKVLCPRRTNGHAPTPQPPRRVRPKIPVFSAPSPRACRISHTTPSRIPRPKRTAAPCVSPRRSTVKTGLQTPRPLHTPVMGVARKAKATKVGSPNTVKTASGRKKVEGGAVRKTSKDAEAEAVGKTVEGEDATKKPEDAAARTRDEEAAARPQVKPEQEGDTGDKGPFSAPRPAATSTPSNQAVRSPGSVMGTLLAQLKNRLLWATKSTASSPTPLSPTKEAFVLVHHPARRRPAQENVQAPSELQHAFARRAAALSKVSSNVDDTAAANKEPRRPLAPLHGFSNLNGRRGPAPTTKTPPCALHVLVPELPVAPLFGRDLGPGADLTVTELVTTPLGTRRVRRTLVPPIFEGTLAVRDPRIMKELDRLRAQQKVGSLASRK
ncbi:hypothetical protein C8R47DRAFT_181528 [Mycena vitilis]|nr:hypothetical protein C8R47DRAFT_181528 [Mycena vitilis]